MEKDSLSALMQARILRERCLELLENVPDSCRKGQYIILDKFECEIDYFERLIFWQKGQRDNKYAQLTPLSQSGDNRPNLFVIRPPHRMILAEVPAGVKIRKYCRDDEDYPHIIFEWTGWSSKDIRPGDLFFVRVDLSEQDFINYDHFDGFKGKVNGHSDKKPDAKVAPISLEDGMDFFGESIKMHIDFDARADEILAESELLAFSGECRRLFG